MFFLCVEMCEVKLTKFVSISADISLTQKIGMTDTFLPKYEMGNNVNSN